MRQFVVTVKVRRDPKHDLMNKQTGTCPTSRACNDTTGEHHTYITTGRNIDDVRQSALEAGWRHVTRVEEMDEVGVLDIGRARKIVAAVLEDLRGRKGLDHELDGVDDETYREMVLALTSKVLDAANGSAE
jgi:hypothetical protein